MSREVPEGRITGTIRGVEDLFLSWQVQVRIQRIPSISRQGARGAGVRFGEKSLYRNWREEGHLLLWW